MKKKLWGGRFSKKTDPLVEEFTRSIQFDYKLAKYDVLGTMVHVEILKNANYITNEEKIKLHQALSDMYRSMKENKFKFEKTAEDIHTNIQNILQKKLGDLALKLHTARSRNDQVVFATKLYCKITTMDLACEIIELSNAILFLAMNNKDVIIPGLTHMQHAQPIYLKDYLGSYSSMFERDSYRIKGLSENINITFGAGALAGTPIDASEYNIKAVKAVKDLVGFDIKVTTNLNSLDAVSDRDFVIEIISALSILAMHLSRLAEDLIIWATKEFDFIEIDEAFCTGSSLMPQKKNPDVLELVRGYTGRLYGNLVSVLTMMKGLPLTYNRDMQLDKEPLFDSFEIVSKELNVLTGLVKTLKFNKEKIEEQLKDESLYATDLVYYLVDKKIPFKEAHTIVGKLVKYSIDNSIQIKEMPEDKLKSFSKEFVKKDIVKLFDPKVSVESKKSINRQKIGEQRAMPENW